VIVGLGRCVHSVEGFPFFSCLFVHEQDYLKSYQVIFVTPCTVMKYCRGKNPFSFGVDATQNGRLAAILVFCYGGAT